VVAEVKITDHEAVVRPNSLCTFPGALQDCPKSDSPFYATLIGREPVCCDFESFKIFGRTNTNLILEIESHSQPH
jgi:hypothetical protein